jgi:two-component sensor histidine kinase
MRTQRVELPARREQPDANPATLLVSRSMGAMLVFGGIFGAATGQAESLAPRQRALTVGASGVCTALGIAASVTPRRFMRILRGAPTPTLPVFGLTALGLTRPADSPMFFPSLLLAACGGGTVGARAAPALGGGTAAGYVTLVGLDATLRLRRFAPSLWWNLGVTPTYVTAAHVGGVLGDLAVSLRALDFARARDARMLAQLGASKETLHALSREASALAAELDQALLEAARFDAGSPLHAEQLRDAIADTRRRTRHLTLAPLLIAAAHGESPGVRAAIETAVAAYALETLSGERLTLDLGLAPDLAIDARSTTVLLQILKRALDNAVEHADAPERVRVAVTVRESASAIALEVEDDGGGAVPAERWGVGLSEAHDACAEIGAKLDLFEGPRGVYVRALIPKVARRVSPAAVGNMTVRVQAAIATIERDLRWANATAAVTTFASARSRPAAGAAALTFAALAAADLHAGPAGTGPATAETLRAAATALIWPRGSRPPAGWLGANLFFIGLRAPRRAVAVATAATGAMTASVMRNTPSRRDAMEALAFPVLCGAGGLGAHMIFEHFRRMEAEVVALDDRAELVERAAQPLRHYHDIVKGLRRSRAWRLGLMESDVGQRIKQLGLRLTALNEDLERHFVPRDPVGQLQHRLAVRLAPVPVTVDGALPMIDASLLEQLVLRRARHSLVLEQVSEQLADDLLQRFPPDLLGRPRLQRVHLRLEPLANAEVHVHVVATGAGGGRRRQERRLPLVTVLAAIGGRLTSGFDDEALSFEIPATALAQR